MKIHIIGCSGSGKSYLAQKLSQKHNLPHFDLDDLQWDNSKNQYGIKMPVDKRETLLNEILALDNWIIEGVYYKWVKQSFKDSDKVIILDIPKRIYKYRIIKRFIKRKLGIEKGKKETLKSLKDLLKWTDKFQNENMKEIKGILKEYENKVITLKNKKDINNFITKEKL